ncbi:TetR/AcrR family transcriptional regulator [Marinomonas sp. C2222]|uniref:TetR/AcrR family transcriptional regulator n=1 Tax=Marinomonas sargassi TaxID=2984494 RepID=A0ABT2YRY1_9GAMM|nr:TetR/AcrR family transcriptional regulator [Marinomonas sargassi]MCV2402645.1 TetR/AcrR family transcriptional regulator [Marinomonas sargassi]
MSLRKEQKANTRAKIKSVAKEAFLTKGIEATSTRYLSQKSGIAVGTLFVHFPDKLSLVKDIFFEEMDSALRAGAVSQTVCSSPIDYLLQMAQVLFDFFDDYAEFTQQILLDSIVKGGFHTNQMAVISDGIISRFKQAGVDEKTAEIFSENMVSNYWYILLNSLPTGTLGQASINQLKRLNLPFEVSYNNAAKNQ